MRLSDYNRTHKKTHILKVKTFKDTERKKMSDKTRANLEFRVRQCTEESMRAKHDPRVGQSRINLGSFQSLIYIYGNLRHLGVRNALIQAHYQPFLNCDFLKEFDQKEVCQTSNGIEEIMKMEEFIGNQYKRIVHVYTEDLLLFDKIKDKVTREYRVIPYACSCFCSEINRRALDSSDVKHLIAANNYHMHFLVEVDYATKDSPIKWVRSFAQEGKIVKYGENGWAITVMDKIRLLHYVMRREATNGLPCHFDHQGTEIIFGRKPKYGREIISQYFPEHLRIIHEESLKKYPRLECSKCKRACRYKLNNDPDNVLNNDDWDPIGEFVDIEIATCTFHRY